LLLNEYPNITVYSEPVTRPFYGVDVDFIPWICKDNEDEIYNFIKNSKSKICFGHFELSGFEMDRGNVCLEGMDRNILQKYDLVLSGHFHHKSSDGQIVYVGTPGEMTWADYDDERGFHILDLNDLSLEFYENPHKMFHKIIYDETQETLEKIQETNDDKTKFIKGGVDNELQVPINIYFKMNSLDPTIDGNQFINMNRPANSIRHSKKVKFLLENESENRPFVFTLVFILNRTNVVSKKSVAVTPNNAN